MIENDVGNEQLELPQPLPAAPPHPLSKTAPKNSRYDLKRMKMIKA